MMEDEKIENTEAKPREALIAARKEKGLTQNAFSIQFGISRRHVIFLEKGLRDPSLELAHEIAQFYGKTIDELFF